ncbi:MAG: UbiA family prenyltransferase [Bacteroidota bacterium]
MKKLAHHITNFYLYSSLHIGLCSVYLYLFTVSRFELNVDFKYLLFTFSSTIFIYSIHRIIGINKVKKFSHKGRFAVIEKFKSHILIYATVSFGGCCYLFFNFGLSRWILLTWAGVVSVLYTIPIFGKAMRLRDFSFIKIFLIAIIWSYVTGVIPMHENGIDPIPIIVYFTEIALFFIAITIPFDIRDYYVDRANKVGTIPTLLGRTYSTYMAILLVLITIVLDAVLTFVYGGLIIGFICMLITCLVTAIMIYFVQNKENDYYFSGLMDTSIMIPYSTYVLIFYFLS